VTSFAVLLLLAQAGAQPTNSAVGPPPARPAITIHTVGAPGVQVFYLNIPWGPETFAAMERSGESHYNRRSWPFARMETTRPLRIEKTRVPEGNYALVFHPNTPKDEGMSLEVRKIAPGEFLQAGNVLTRTPEGETLWRAPVAFDTAEQSVVALEIEAVTEASGVRLHVRYGDRTTQAVFSIE
jgi:hypothetical protein